MAPSAESSIISVDVRSPFVEAPSVPFAVVFDRFASTKSWPSASSAVLLVPTMTFAEGMTSSLSVAPCPFDSTTGFLFLGIGEAGGTPSGAADISRLFIALPSEVVVLRPN